MRLNIGIDGPVGAGKSSVADAVAARLGILHLDTGAMYRALGLTALRRGMDVQDEPAQIADPGRAGLGHVLEDAGRGQAPVLHQQMLRRDRESRHRLPVVVADEPVHEGERRTLRQDGTDGYLVERAHFQKS